MIEYTPAILCGVIAGTVTRVLMLGQIRGNIRRGSTGKLFILRWG